MSNKIKILILEDNQNDAELLQRELKKSGLSFSSEIVQTRETFENALDRFKPDIILSDYSLPSFDGVSAFHIKQKKYSDIPFIIVSGTLGEEKAVELIKNGVTDYTLKNKLFSLAPKITRALKEEKEKKEKRIVNKRLKTEHEKLLKSEIQIRNFAKHLNQVMEDGQARIARDLHDELGQQLVGIKMGIRMIKEDNYTEQSMIDEKINKLMADVDTTIQSLRKIASQLRPGIIDTLGLIPSIEFLVKEFKKKTTNKCHLELNNISEKFDKDVSTCFFRICQESLTNILKHAEATEIAIEIKKENKKLSLKISDNGKGIASRILENPFSMGLLGMRERASIIGADLNITSKKDFGTTVQLKVKIN